MPNKCASCSVCCNVFPIKELSKPVGILCPYYKYECSIYNLRPEDCVRFNCAYIEGANVPETLRPDQCGVMFFKKTDRIFVAVIVPDIPITDMAYRQVREFGAQGYSVVVLSLDHKQEPIVVLSDGHSSKDISMEYMRAINGNI